MNPTSPQSDPQDDVNSLEGSDTVIEQGAQNSPAQTSPNGLAQPPTGMSPLSDGPVHRPPSDQLPQQKGPSFFKRIWAKMNIYILIFVLVMLVASAVVVVLTVKDRQQANVQNTINTQGLSESTLKQLANSEATIGSSSQILNIESNAIFAGSILIKKDLEVAGNIKMNGALALPGITVSGTSTLNQVQATTLNLSGAATVNGTLTARGGLSVTGNGSFTGNVSATQLTTGSLQLNGDLILTHHITGGGAIPGLSRGIALGSGGTASVSGSDTSGSITINTGSAPGAGCFATVNFAKAFNGPPHVSVTPIGAAAGGIAFYVNRSSTSFSVCTTSPAAAGQTFGFDYIILN
jgi:cytoskeletal protein CcmA (bactofilin family)